MSSRRGFSGGGGSAYLASLSAGTYSGQVLTWNGSAYQPGTFVDIRGGADVVQLSVRANSSQTANLQEWQNSSGTALVRITPGGDGFFNLGAAAGRIRIGAYTTASYGAIYVGTAADSPSASNYTFLGSTSETYLNNPASTFLAIANNPKVAVTANEISVMKPLIGDSAILASPYGCNGYVTIANADATHVATSAQYKYHVMKFTGTLTANRQVTMPALDGYTKYIWNATVGGFSLLVKTASGANTITVANARIAMVGCDGTEIFRCTPDNVLT